MWWRGVGLKLLLGNGALFFWEAATNEPATEIAHSRRDTSEKRFVNDTMPLMEPSVTVQAVARQLEGNNSASQANRSADTSNESIATMEEDEAYRFTVLDALRLLLGIVFLLCACGCCCGMCCCWYVCQYGLPERWQSSAASRLEQLESKGRIPPIFNPS
eukprot:TRINITY_DN70411_c0_g1_i1.p1 TRINITY_DN70411_c0_g1~~TRINITY_DN70411_c0_g1_i1.p1  ORF type:complete len:160 (+),score=8.97 TRINITY_DN70411_c0_g1_i1:37-516(+)